MNGQSALRGFSLFLHRPMTRNFLIFLFLSIPMLVHSQLSGNPENSGEDLARTYKQAWFSQNLGYEVPLNGNFLFYDTLSTWLGTPYRFAGNCEKGIDCSGFVNILYDRVFGIKIGARNSAEIYTLVEKIDRDELQEGDLVFFRIRSRSRISHVGVYLGNQKFAHASTSKGVIISDLNEPYYKKYFAGAGRHQEVVNRLATETSQ